MKTLRGVVAGTGYFSQFHFDAWMRMPDVEIVAVCGLDPAQVRAVADRHGIARVYDDAGAMLREMRPDFIDIATPPDSHAGIARLAGEVGADILCQKALAPSFKQAQAIVSGAEAAGVRLMVHDNFRFQPWHREMRRLIDQGAIGAVQAIASRTRMGDGWAPDAYLARQPYFRDMPRFLVFETGVHFIDVYRFLGGEITSVFARLRRLNPDIAGEDSAILLFDFANGATGLWDADRYHDGAAADPRHTFGQFWVDGAAGSLRLDGDGNIFIRALGGAEMAHGYPHDRTGFAGDSVFATFEHFIRKLRDGGAFETSGTDYLRTLAVQEAAYHSAAANRPVAIP